MLILSAGHMGLPELALDGEDPFIAVELDTSFDPSLVDINTYMIPIDVNTVVSLATVNVVSREIDLTRFQVKEGSNSSIS